MPRVLIVDDDPVSLRFLAAAISGFGCSVVAAANAEEALTALQWAAFDLLLLDRRMPDRNGAELLADLRARHVRAPAIATSAELSASITAQLRAAGFAAAIEKPISLAHLQQALQPYLQDSGRSSEAANESSLLDDASAAATIGSNAEALYALRRLFAEELSSVESEWSSAKAAIQSERLHRLRASCGFCGATALGEAARHLEQALRNDGGNVQGLLQEFLRLCRLTRSALDSSVAGSR